MGWEEWGLGLDGAGCWHCPLLPCRMIYKCAMCDTVFTHKPLLSSHFDQHLLPQRVSVFKCPSCPLLFAQKRTMLEHLKVQESRDGGGVLSCINPGLRSHTPLEVGAGEKPGLGQSQALPPPPNSHTPCLPLTEHPSVWAPGGGDRWERSWGCPSDPQDGARGAGCVSGRDRCPY